MYIKFLSIVLTCLYLSACGGGSSSDSPDQPNEVVETVETTEPQDEAATSESDENASLEDESDSSTSDSAPDPDIVEEQTLASDEFSFRGQAVKGIISNALIHVYPITQSNGVFAIDFSSQPLTTRSGSNGGFQLKPGKGGNSKYFFVELTTDSDTLMKCDFHLGCTSPETGEWVDFGGIVQLPSNFKLSNIAQARAGKISNVALSPMTHIAANYSRSLSGGLDDQNILTGKNYVEVMLGLSEGSIDKTPTDLTQIADLDNVKEAELALGIFAAAFYPFINTNDWDDPSSQPLAELFAHARDLSAHLSSLATSNRVSRKVVSIQALATEQLESTEPPEETLAILSQPQSTEVNEGDAATFSVTVNKPEQAIYQWHKNGEQIPGTNNDTLTIGTTNLADEGVYTVSVSDGSTTVDSLAALLTVHPLIEEVQIQTQPDSIVVREGDSAFLEVQATGSGDLSYAWQKGGSYLPNETGSRLAFPNITLLDAGTYSVTVSNSAGSVQSEFATITVNEAITPISITSSPTDKTVIEGQSVSFSVSAEGGGYISYQWRKNGSAIANAYSSTYSIAEVTLNDAGDYDVLVSNTEGSVISSAASLEITPLIAPVVIHQGPSDTLVNEGEDAFFSVTASGGGTLIYTWYKDGIEIPNGNTADYLISASSLDDSGNYSVMVSNEHGTVHSVRANLTVLEAVPSKHNIELSWIAPTQRDDGSNLLQSEIAGYEVHFSIQGEPETNILSIDSNTANSYILELDSGVYDFQIATKTTDNQVSEFSETITLHVE